MSTFRERRRKGQAKKEVVTEPVRRSLYDVVLTNMRLAHRVVYVHRLLYIGEHSFEDIEATMLENIKNVNDGHNPESLTAIFLHYQQYFCHIVEGSEEILIKHLTLLFQEHRDQLQKCKLLTAVHHIKGRFFNGCLSYIGKPPERVEEIDMDNNLDNSMRYIQECTEKLYNFANALVADHLREVEKNRKRSMRDEEDDELSEFSDDESIISPELDQGPVISLTAIANVDPYIEILPELKLINFLVNNKYLRNVEDYVSHYRKVIIYENYGQKVWPAPPDLVPYDVFDKPFDPIENLPSKFDTVAEEVPEEEIILIDVEESEDTVAELPVNEPKPE